MSATECHHDQVEPGTYCPNCGWHNDAPNGSATPLPPATPAPPPPPTPTTEPAGEWVRQFPVWWVAVALFFSPLWGVYWWYHVRRQVYGLMGDARASRMTVPVISYLVPVWNIFAFYWLFRDVRLLSERTTRRAEDPGLMTALLFGGNLILGNLAIVGVLAYAQDGLNRVFSDLAPSRASKFPFSFWNIAFFVLGVLMLLLLVAAIFALMIIAIAYSESTTY